jgi:DNA-binding NtrC family response regulator
MSHALNSAASAGSGRVRAFAKQRVEVVSRDPASKRLLQHLERVAPSDASVLIVGESGTGKERIARYVHAKSGRRGSFVAVNCGALSPALAEAELFGHEAGSFTGATGARAGWFEAANGGTLLLDEIAELPAELQVKILRVLQEREVVRVGSRRPIPIDVRLIAATNVDLGEAVAAGRFRVDLYYRLNVVSASLAPLRERPADIVPLAEHFLAVYGERLRAPVPRLLPETQLALLQYDWPGNIRELENVIQAAIVASTDKVIRPQNLRFHSSSPAASGAPAAAPSSIPARDTALDTLLGPLDRLFQSPPSQLFPKVEELLVRRAYSHCRGNQVLAARLLGIPSHVMRTQLRRYGLADGAAVAGDA